MVPEDGFRDHIRDFADRLATRSRLSTQAMKQIIDAIAVNDPAVPAISGYWQDQRAASGEPDIGIHAFLAKQTGVQLE